MAFATTTDVETRLGRFLTAAETAMAEMVIEQVTDMIAEAVGKDSAWAAALTPVPAYYQALCIEKTLAVGRNPNQLAAMSERLGQHEVSETFRGGRAASSDLFLTEEEERRLRRVTFGRTTDSVMLGSHFQEVED